jgi:hypothetical protein
MSAWRRRALEAFPEAANDDDAMRSTFGLFFWLLPAVAEAHRTGDTDFARRAYGYAQWAHHQRAGSNLGNAADVGFYEHLFDDWSLREHIAPWLDSSIRREVWTLWSARLDVEQLDELERLFRRTPPGGST